jgi:hypothetical protein
MSHLHDAISNEQLKRDECSNDLIREILLHDNFRMNTGMVDTAPLIIWLL